MVVSDAGVSTLTKLWFGIGIGIGKSNSDRIGWEYFGIGVEERSCVNVFTAEAQMCIIKGKKQI